MFSKKIREFISKGIDHASRESKEFEQQHKKMQAEIESFNRDMKKWSESTRLIRKK